MPRGRPRNFDRDLALRRAMDVFWAKGYEGAQLTDLTTAMGINPPSFYAAFGSKEAAFREALKLYEHKMGEGRIKAFGDDLDTRGSIRAMLDHGIDVALAAPGSGGCLIMLGMINAAPGNEPLRDLLRNRRREGLAQVLARLERGVRDGDLPPSTDVMRLAMFYCAMLQAISLQARDGATREELDDIAAVAMRAMPESENAGAGKQEATSGRRKPRVKAAGSA